MKALVALLVLALALLSAVTWHWRPEASAVAEVPAPFAEPVECWADAPAVALPTVLAQLGR